MNIESTVVYEMLFVAIIAGLAAIIIQMKKRQSTKGRQMKLSNLIRFYLVEFSFGSLAGILMYGIAVPVDTKQMILFGIIAGINSEIVVNKSKNMLTDKKIDAIDAIETSVKDNAGEGGNDGKG